MQLRKFRWSKVYESSEEELVNLLKARGIKSNCISLPEQNSTQYDAHKYAQTLWCAEGSLYLAADGIAMPLQPGDAVQIPSNTAYKIDAGIAGCLFYVSR